MNKAQSRKVCILVLAIECLQIPQSFRELLQRRDREWSLPQFLRLELELFKYEHPIPLHVAANLLFRLTKTAVTLKTPGSFVLLLSKLIGDFWCNVLRCDLFAGGDIARSAKKQ